MTDKAVYRQAVRSLRHHPSETIIGRITNSGSWDRRFRRPIRQAEPVTPPSLAKLLVEAFGVLIAAYLLFVAFLVGMP